MDINSKECIEALKKYKATGKIQKIAIKLLLLDDRTPMPEMEALNNSQLRDLQRAVRIIRDTIGIED